MTSSEFEILINSVRPRLIFFAKGFVGEGAATADDMVQDAIIKLWNSNKVRDIENPEAFLRHILRNVCLDYIKLKKNNTEQLTSYNTIYSERSLTAEIEAKDEMTMVFNFMRTLPNDQMVTLRLRDVMGYEMSEIAVILDTTEGNIRTLLSRARKKLREMILLNKNGGGTKII